MFLLAATNRIPKTAIEAIFVEAIGVENYARMSGMTIDAYDKFGEYVETHTMVDGALMTTVLEGVDRRDDGALFIAREPFDDEDDPDDGEPIRQEECESLALCAFYWQTVIGMEGVRAFIDGGEGTGGSLKALALLQTRIGLSPAKTSRSRAMESLIPSQESSEGTTATATSSGSVRLPADHKPPTKPGKGSIFHKRR